MTDTYQTKQEASALFASNAPYVEDQYAAFLNGELTPGSYWHDYFSTITQNDSSAVDHQRVVDRFKVYAQQPSVVHKQADNNPSQAQVTAYVQAYRFYGHQVAATNPLFENTTSLP